MPKTFELGDKDSAVIFREDGSFETVIHDQKPNDPVSIANGQIIKVLLALEGWLRR